MSVPIHLKGGCKVGMVLCIRLAAGDVIDASSEADKAISAFSLALRKRVEAIASLGEFAGRTKTPLLNVQILEALNSLKGRHGLDRAMAR